MADKICQKRKNGNMKIGDKIKLKKLDYADGSQYRTKVEDGVHYVCHMSEYNILFEIIEIERSHHGNIYKITKPNYATFWVEEWQIKPVERIKLEI